MRSLLDRGVFNNILAVGGVLLVVLQVLLMAYTRAQVAVVMVGILINQAGVWGLANRVLPSRRVYLPLRREIENFIQLARDLNEATVAGSGTVDAVRRRMHESVDRMADAAGMSGHQ